MSAKQLLFTFLALLFLLATSSADHNVITECNCIRRGDTPTKQQLMLLDVPDLELSLRIKDSIFDYDTLGTFLLNDETGVVLQRISQDYRFSKQIIDEIFDRWIRGEGQIGILKLNTWDMLVKYLKYAKLMILADELESILQYCTHNGMHLEKECVTVNAGQTRLELGGIHVSVVTIVVVIGTAVIAVFIVYYKAGDSRYTAYLKRRYKPKKKNSTMDGDDTRCLVHITKIFRVPMIKCKEKRSFNADYNSMQNKEGDAQIELKDIFRGVEGDKQTKVLIEGIAGSGKSTLSLHLCHQWRDGTMLQEYTYVILVKLREESVQQAQNIADILPHDNTTIGLEAEKEFIDCNGKGVLFIFDGWDELPRQPCAGQNLIMEIVKRKRLTECSFIITSRPLSNVDLQHHVSFRIQMLRFEKSELQRFLAYYLNSSDKDNIVTLLHGNPVLESYFCIPLNAVILVYLVRCGYHLPTSEYELFYKLVLCRIVRHQEKKWGKSIELTSLNNLPDNIKSEFDNLCKVAYMGARNGMVIFYQECLHDKIIHEHFQQANFNILGLLQGVESFAMQGESVSYNFVHLAIQELLSAIYLATQLSPNEQIKIFEKHFGQPRFTGIFRYYVAYRKFNTPGIESILVQAVKYPRKTKLVTTQSDEFLLTFQYSTFEYASQPLLLSIIHCLFHAKDDDLYRLLAQKLNQQLNLSGIRLTLADCQSVGVFLTYCNQFRVNIKSCSIGTQECNMLFRQNQSYPLKSLDLNGNSIGVGGAVGFSEAIKTMTNLQELSLGYNSIGIEGAEAIAGAMKSMTNLQMLYLNHNSIGDEGAVALSEAMTTMSNLQWLSLFKNSIGDDGALAISDAMKDMANLQWLSLTNNAISEIGREALQKAAQLTGTKIHV